MRLKDAEKKFIGDLGECWSEFVDQYTGVGNEYNPTPQVRLLHFLNILGKDAQRFYLGHVRDYATTFEQTVNKIELEYIAPVRQKRVKNYLSNPRASHLVSKGTEVSTALAKFHRQITNLSRQVQQSH